MHFQSDILIYLFIYDVKLWCNNLGLPLFKFILCQLLKSLQALSKCLAIKTNALTDMHKTHLKKKITADSNAPYGQPTKQIVQSEIYGDEICRNISQTCELVKKTCKICVSECRHLNIYAISCYARFCLINKVQVWKLRVTALGATRNAVEDWVNHLVLKFICFISHQNSLPTLQTSSLIDKPLLKCTNCPTLCCHPLSAGDGIYCAIASSYRFFPAFPEMHMTSFIVTFI